MKFEDAILRIKQELHRAETLHPVWPTDKIHAAAIVSEESGELVQACNNHESGDKSDLREMDHLRKKVELEAIHTAVTAIRFLINM